VIQTRFRGIERGSIGGERLGEGNFRCPLENGPTTRLAAPSGASCRRPSAPVYLHPGGPGSASPCRVMSPSLGSPVRAGSNGQRQSERRCGGATDPWGLVPPGRTRDAQQGWGGYIRTPRGNRVPYLPGRDRWVFKKTHGLD
jgi:hypothetical protein